MPPILPLVVYHGQTRWSASDQFQDLLATPNAIRELIASHVPSFLLQVEQLQHTPDEKLPGAGLDRLALMMFKHGRGGNVVDALRTAANLMIHEIHNSASGLRRVSIILEYALVVNDKATRDALRTTIGSLDPTLENAIMTAGQRLIEQGIEQGIEKGRLETLAKSVLMVIRSRGLKVSDDDERRVLASTDVTELERWLQRAVTADSATDALH